MSSDQSAKTPSLPTRLLPHGVKSDNVRAVRRAARDALYTMIVEEEKVLNAKCGDWAVQALRNWRIEDPRPLFGALRRLEALRLEIFRRDVGLPLLGAWREHVQSDWIIEAIEHELDIDNATILQIKGCRAALLALVDIALNGGSPQAVPTEAVA